MIKLNIPSSTVKIDYNDYGRPAFDANIYTDYEFDAYATYENEECIQFRKIKAFYDGKKETQSLILKKERWRKFKNLIRLILEEDGVAHSIYYTEPEYTIQITYDPTSIYLGHEFISLKKSVIDKRSNHKQLLEIITISKNDWPKVRDFLKQCVEIKLEIRV